MCHPESMTDSFSQTNVTFLTTNITLRFKPLDAEVIQNFQVKYKKRPVERFFAQITENSSESRIKKDIDILMPIKLTQEKWKGTFLQNL